MSEVERVEGAEGNESVEGVVGVESYSASRRWYVYPSTLHKVHWTNLVALRY